MKNKKQSKEEKIAEERALIESYKLELGEHKFCWKCLGASIFNNLGGLLTVSLSTLFIIQVTKLHGILMQTNELTAMNIILLLTCVMMFMRNIAGVVYELVPTEKIYAH